jgi:hypothetical protein
MLDDILNVVIPLIIILAVVAFVYGKIIEPLLMPHIRKLFAKKEQQDVNYGKEILYE